MTLKEIYQFFQAPPAMHLNKELATCFVLSTLLSGDSYGTELIQLIEKNHPPYRLSDTVLYNSLKFLEKEGVITGYLKKVEGRGRPRRMYQIIPEKKAKAEDLARLWQGYVNSNEPALAYS